MIPEYQLFNHLLLLKSNYFFKREIKKKLGHLKAKDYRNTYNLIFNSNQNLMFMKIISVYLYFNKISYKEYLRLVANFILTISALIPTFKRQEKQLDDYQNAKELLLLLGCKDQIKVWFDDTSKVVLPDFLINNSNLKKESLLIIKRLVNISGNIFINLTKNETNIKNNYEFGSLLMLFYLLDLETRKTLLTKDSTDLNLKAFFSYETLFTNKLIILDELVKCAMRLEQTNFNFYIRIMNYSLLGNYQ